MGETSLEQELEAAVEADVALGPGADEPRREIPASAILNLIQNRGDISGRANRLWLRRIRITGHLDLAAYRVGIRLWFEDCELLEPIELFQCCLESLGMIACQLREGFNAGQVDVRWNLRLDHSEVAGGATLSNARIGGQLSMANATIGHDTSQRDDPSTAIVGDGLWVGSDLFLDGLKTTGEVRMLGAKVGGQLSMNGAELGLAGDGDPSSSALNADGIEVAQGMFCRDGFVSTGEMRLLGAQIEGQLSMTGASLKGAIVDADSFRPAFSGDQLRVSRGVFFDGVSAVGEVRLPGARVGGRLSMTGAKLAVPTNDPEMSHSALNADGAQLADGVYCDDLESTGEFRLLGARVGGQLSLNGATLKSHPQANGRQSPALSGDGMEVAGGVFCRREFSSNGEVRLVAAKVSGQLSVVGARMAGSLDDQAVLTPSLNADGIEVVGSAICNDIEAKGEFRLPGARISGQLSMERTSFSGGRNNPAFSADRIEVAQGIFSDGFSAVGEVRLLGAKIHGQLSMDGAMLTCKTEEGPPRPALNGEGIEIAQGLFCSMGFTADGEVQLSESVIGGQLLLMGASLSGPSNGPSLTLVAAQVDELVLGLKEVNGTVDLRNASVRSLLDASASGFTGALPKDLRLDGFAYESLREPLGAKQRLQWIDASQQRRHYPDVYAQLATAFRRIGHHGEARKVAIANERRARRDCPPRSLRRLAHDLLWVTVGYGYRNWLALFWVLGTIALGAVVFGLNEDSFTPTRDDPPSLDTTLYAIDATVPVLDLGQTHWWSATGCMAWVELFLALSGYALVAAVIAAAAGLLNRDQV